MTRTLFACWISALVATMTATAAERSEADFAWVGSDSCRSCHQDHHASWHQTYHRTMTQEATPRSVLGAFDGRELTYWGQTIRPVRRGDAFYFEYLDGPGGEVVGIAEIKRTVGSHRYQQYLAQAPGTGENYIRMHLLWHIGDQRWVHMNGAFLYTDDQGPNKHVATWNHNCIFCHNTGPQPRITNYEALHARLARGERLNFLNEARYESTVAELGIACESCHGPGQAHAEAMRNPITRYWYHFTPAADAPDIVNPAKLSPQRSAQVCGQCHAQRQPAGVDLVERWLKRGPTYRAGDDLHAHVSLVTPETPGTASNPDLYRLRFWPDGTPRLSAYEYTGLRMSACYSEGEATCIDCHEAHGGSPEGMITEANRDGASCVDCHAAIGSDVVAHTRHPADSEASQCVSCHMPKAVYGVMAIHRSHNIERPDPVGHAADHRPDGCVNCHVTRTAEWLEQSIAHWGGSAPPTAGTGTPAWLEQLLGGDPVQRSVAAEMAGEPSIAPQGAERLWLIPPLLSSLADDYPAVRRFAAHSVRDIADARGGALADLDAVLADYDFIADADTRRAVEREAWRRWRAVAETLGARPDWIAGATVRPDLLARLRTRARQNQQKIEIGE